MGTHEGGGARRRLDAVFLGAKDHRRHSYRNASPIDSDHGGLRKVIKISGVLLSLWLVAASSAAQSLLPDYWNDSSHEVAQPVDNADMTEDNYVFQGQSLNSDQSDDEIEIYSSDGYIYIRSSKKQSAKVFTILGQLVFNGNVGPGLTEIQMQPRGIYIVKVGSVTQKVAL